MSTTGRVYGWRKQREDIRDYLFVVAAPFVATLPPVVDLRPGCPPVYDQGRIGSCTANAIAAALDFARIKNGVQPITPSRLFIYWQERNAEGTVPKDAGGVLRDGIKLVNSVGAPPEALWPYDDTPADPSTHLWPEGARPTIMPDEVAQQEASSYESIIYLAVPQSLDQMRGCLAQGFPFVFGFQVYAGFESQEVAQTGDAYLPSSGEACLGGHAVLCVGYDDGSRRFMCRNSWGEGWGRDGYFTMPYEYMTNPQLASDFWSIRSTKS